MIRGYWFFFAFGSGTRKMVWYPPGCIPLNGLKGNYIRAMLVMDPNCRYIEI